MLYCVCFTVKASSLDFYLTRLPFQIPGGCAIIGFKQLSGRDIIRVCRKYHKTFRIVVDDPTLDTIDLRLGYIEQTMAPTDSIAMGTVDEFAKNVETTYGWTRMASISTGVVTAIQFTPTTVTQMSSCETLLGLPCVLEIEFKPSGWWISYLENKGDTENPIRNRKRREPELFRVGRVVKTGTPAGKHPLPQ